jgi:2,3-bisphosphoglycerate-independent phosphoglycerate mutase
MEPSGTRLAGPAGTNMKTWGYRYPLLCAREVGVFLLPVKATDTSDDSDLDRKVALIERVDPPTAVLMNLEPDVLIVAGDHPTPSLLPYHTWHSAPVAVRTEHPSADGVSRLGERGFVAGAVDQRFVCVECPSRAETSCG